MGFDPVRPEELKEIGAADLAKRMEGEGYVAVEVQGDAQHIYIVFAKPKKDGEQ